MGTLRIQRLLQGSLLGGLVAIISIGAYGQTHAGLANGHQQQFWEKLTALCGQAHEGQLTVFDPQADAGWLNQPMKIHVRECSDHEIKIPLVVGEDRSRTWVLTRHPDGIELKHDHRHEDGSDDRVTWYGGKTTDDGTHWRQAFPVDQYSRSLFFAEGLSASVDNVWYLELLGDHTLAYGLTRPNRHFRGEFDLTKTVEAPLAPWGHE